MAHPSVDFDVVLSRLVLYAQSLNAALVCVGLKERVLPGGESAEDLAMATLLKFLDPTVTSVAWSEEKGEQTTAKVIGYLRKVLWRDFLDLKKKKCYRTTVYVGMHASEQEENPELTLDEFAAALDDPERQVLKWEQREWVLKQFEAEPELKEIVELQLDPDGCNAFSNQDLARLTETTLRTSKTVRSESNWR
jgi:hypothetical protein